MVRVELEAGVRGKGKGGVKGGGGRGGKMYVASRVEYMPPIAGSTILA